MHTSDMLVGRRRCARLVLQMHIKKLRLTILNRLEQGPHVKSTCACERGTFSDNDQIVVQLSICTLATLGTKMLHFQPNFASQKHIFSLFSTNTAPTSPQVISLDTTHIALSSDICGFVSSSSIPDLHERHSSRVFSPGR